MTAPVAAEVLRLAEAWATASQDYGQAPRGSRAESEAWDIVKAAADAFRTALTAALAAPQGAGELVASLFAAIAHGDDVHRDWLRRAIDDHFAGRPVERARSAASVVAADPIEQVARALAGYADTLPEGSKDAPFIRSHRIGLATAALSALGPMDSAKDVERQFVMGFADTDLGALDGRARMNLLLNLWAQAKSMRDARRTR